MEEEIEKLVRDKSLVLEILDVWLGKPATKVQFNKGDVSHIVITSQYELQYMQLWGEIEALIAQESLEMCLTSKYLYIRRYKKWLEEEKAKEVV
jgi:hypothetical protein